MKATNLIDVILEETVTTITEFTIPEEDYYKWDGKNTDFLFEKDNSNIIFTHEENRNKHKKIITKLIKEKQKNIN